jgi:hypothetical protein
MTLDEARQKLGINDDNASPEIIKRQYRRLASKYHPDKGNYRDGREFGLVNSAYMLLTADMLGVSKVRGIPIEVAETLDIKNAIYDYLDSILEDFKELRFHTEKETIEKIENDIFSARSKSDLKNILNGSVTRQLLDLKTTVASYIKDVKQRVSADKNDFIFKLFSEMYEDRRKYWLLTLWKNPILILESIGIFSIFAIRESTFMQSEYLSAWEFTNKSWVLLGLLIVGILALAIEYIRLSPKNQFVPPKISLDGLHVLLKEQAEKIPVTDTEAGVGGGVAGAFFGTGFLPGLGTLIGGLVGGIIGSLFGKSFDDIKYDVSRKLNSEIESGFQQVGDRLTSWVSKAKDELYNAVLDSFYKNSMTIARLAGTKKLPLIEHKKS